jgi:hypothetical protein
MSTQFDMFAPPAIATPPCEKPRAEPPVWYPVLEVCEDERYWLNEARQGVDTEREDAAAFRLLYIVRYVDRLADGERYVWKITKLGLVALRSAEERASGSA